jgi:hypothetical protein
MLVGIGLGDVSLPGQRLIAGVIVARRSELRLVARQVRPCLIDLGLEWPRVDVEEHVPGLHEVAFVKGDVEQHAGHQRRDGDGLHGFDDTARGE